MSGANDKKGRHPSQPYGCHEKSRINGRSDWCEAKSKIEAEPGQRAQSDTSNQQYPFVGKYLTDSLDYFLQEAEKAQAARIGVVDRIVGAVRVQVERLRAAQGNRFHSDRIDLGESSLLRVVVAIDGVIEF